MRRSENAHASLLVVLTLSILATHTIFFNGNWHLFFRVISDQSHAASVKSAAVLSALNATPQITGSNHDTRLILVPTSMSRGRVVTRDGVLLAQQAKMNGFINFAALPVIPVECEELRGSTLHTHSIDSKIGAAIVSDHTCVLDALHISRPLLLASNLHGQLVHTREVGTGLLVVIGAAQIEELSLVADLTLIAGGDVTIAQVSGVSGALLRVISRTGSITLGQVSTSVSAESFASRGTIEGGTILTALPTTLPYSRYKLLGMNITGNNN